MMKTNLPPQAYTRDVFASAYEWLQTQSDSIRELAQTPDDLVALYLQARRHGHLNNTESTRSSKSFKNDLKNLAEGLRQFEENHSPSASAVTEKVRETTKHSFTFTNPPPPPVANYRVQQVVEDPLFTRQEMPPLTEDYEEIRKSPPPPRSTPEPVAKRTTQDTMKEEKNDSWDLQQLDPKSK
ncbi:MAG: hypothetical protein KDD40_05425, partial [Bdellovibrionales bacterium]|nr:hypothetical protein [Bdellovibrionales bacterium]